MTFLNQFHAESQAHAARISFIFIVYWLELVEVFCDEEEADFDEKMEVCLWSGKIRPRGLFAFVVASARIEIQRWVFYTYLMGSEFIQAFTITS